MKHIKLFEQFITEADKMYDIAAEVYDIVDYKDLGNKNKIKAALKKLGYSTDPLMLGAVMRKIQSELNEAVRVETNRYERSHGKKPRGYGQWAFYFDDRGGEPIFTPKPMSYSDAVKWAKGEAKKAGKEYIYVGESLNEGYSDEERMELAKKGLALPDGSFPIVDIEDLKNAIQAYGRAKDQSAAAKFIAKRARALGATDLIPDTEDFQKSLNESINENVMTISDMERSYRNTIDLSVWVETQNEALANKAASAINKFAKTSSDVKKLQKENSASISNAVPKESYADPGEWYFSWSMIFSLRTEEDINIANKIVNDISSIAKKLKIDINIEDNIFSRKTPR